jgi:glycosyltransferase involved in cell wall biosynthesis
VSDGADQVDISVIICTRNRAGPLGVLLASLERLKVPAGLTWELLIVDNGSTDTTAAVVEGFTARLPVRYTREDKAGLSNARNHGVAAARGRYICWTDDDVEIDDNWLAAYAAAFKAHPDAALFGGRIYPKLDAPTPPWFAKLLDRWPISDIVAARDFGDAEVPLGFDADRVPWGANFAVRTTEQRRFAYDPNLGVSPDQRRSGEETQMMFQLLGSGATGWWAPASKVFHLYPTRRQTMAYFYDHYFAIGETKAYLDHAHRHHYMNRDGANGGRPATLWVRLRMAVNAVLYRIFRLIGLRLRSLYHLRRLAMDAGALSFRP